ncbi:MAG: hypothetical protein HKN46_09515, partial [Acidimicrobiia bacterium]|nr:hypothetical protein [Acidimicrobiia bacterium]
MSKHKRGKNGFEGQPLDPVNLLKGEVARLRRELERLTVANELLNGQRLIATQVLATLALHGNFETDPIVLTEDQRLETELTTAFRVHLENHEEEEGAIALSLQYTTEEEREQILDARARQNEPEKPQIILPEDE